MNKFKKRPNVVQYVATREINEEINEVFQERLHVTRSLIDRLGQEEELQGHEGCVNCLEWSESGRYLASGSDDTNVILWDPFHKKLLCVYPTEHQGNIFTVKFLPQSSDTKIVTGAADFQVLALDAVTKETYYTCSCAHSRIKRIATSPDSPHVFWSASEDGIIRQTDLRNRHACDNKVENVIINLRNHIGALAECKCITVNPLRTEMMAVGSNDPYIRLYDRRMIKTTTDYASSNWYRRMIDEQTSGSCTESDLVVPWEVTDNLVNGCVQYFVPGHLQLNGRRKQKHTTVTYLSFSPDGRELLANLGGEQVYLFDVTRKHAPKYFSIPNIQTKNTDYETVKNPFSEYSNGVVNDVCANEDRSKDLPESILKMKLQANEYYQTGEYTEAIKIYNEAIRLHGTGAVLFGNRAAAYMKRLWKGDLYAALRDSYTAVKLDPDYPKVFFRLVRCFHLLKLSEEAKDCLSRFKTKFDSLAESPACRALEKDIEVTYKKNKSRKNNKNGFYLSNTNIELRLSQPEKLWRDKAWDYEHRYCGHCNATTDIKEANFFGRDGRHIVAGSDDGSIYFWDRQSENNIRILKGDSSIVNCLQPHPSYCLLASCGIDPVVRLWTPMPEENWFNDRIVENLALAGEKNNKRKKRSHREEIFYGTSSSSEDSSLTDEGPNSCRTS